MNQIIFGTTNPGKVAQIQAALDPLGIRVAGLPSDIDLPEIEESGATPLENARIKALAYSEAIGKPVLSMDNALYLDGLEEAKQPGVNVRRIPGLDHRPDDEEMINYYSGLIKDQGGEVTGRWEFGICIAFPDGRTKEVLAISPRQFTSKVSENRTPGYPLESIQKDLTTGKYLVDMPKEDIDQFWQEQIGEKIRELFSGLEEFNSELNDESHLPVR